MSLFDRMSFAKLAAFDLPVPHILHPYARNPVVDVVVLLHTTGGVKNGVTPMKVALWRMMGTKVWEYDAKGQVLGLTWDAAGQ